MFFHLITNVWGKRHTELFLRLTLPNILSPRNLPALAAEHTVRYRIHTTPADRARIEAHAVGGRLTSLVPIDFVTPLGARTPEPVHHVHWFHKTAAEAKRDGAIAVFIPPDTLWSDGTLERCGELMTNGYDAIATPFLQVVAESCIDEALARFTLPADGSLCIPASGLTDLARRHLHPLTALAMPTSPHARPALERYWPVAGEGIVSRFAVRELFAFDPRKRPITFLWYAGGAEDLAKIYFASGPHDMGMLSVDPIDKYLENYIVGHTVSDADLVRSTLHPWNDTQQTRTFTRRRVIWSADGRPTARWRREIARSDRATRVVEVRRTAQQLWKGLKDLGCHRAAGALAVGLEVTDLATTWSEPTPLTVFVPTDNAFAADGGGIDRLLRLGSEQALVRAIRRHVVRGSPGLEPGMLLTLDGTQLTVVSDAAGPRVGGQQLVSGPHTVAGVVVFLIGGVLASEPESDRRRDVEDVSR